MSSAAAPWVGSLVVLSLLFLLRVLAQAVQAVGEVGWLPAFDSWQSGALAYPILLVSQVAILAVQAVLIHRLVTGRYQPKPLVRTAMVILGAVYFGFMLFRLVAGLTVLSGHGWFDAPLPSIFHMVLASFLLVLSQAGAARSEIPS